MTVCNSVMRYFVTKSHFSCSDEIVKIQSSDLIHFLPASTVLKSTQLVQVRSGFWHHEVMEKRIMMGIWKVKNKGSNSGNGNHKTRGSLVVDTV